MEMKLNQLVFQNLSDRLACLINKLIIIKEFRPEILLLNFGSTDFAINRFKFMKNAIIWVVKNQLDRLSTAQSIQIQKQLQPGHMTIHPNYDTL